MEDMSWRFVMKANFFLNFQSKAMTKEFKHW